jgi:hypothetical protein
LFGEFAEQIHLMAVDGLEQGFARWKVPIESADADACRFGDGFKTAAAGAEDQRRGLQQLFAVAGRIGARLSCGFCG